jgi:predicted RNase H-like HicB family nuclease
LGGRTQNECP